MTPDDNILELVADRHVRNLYIYVSRIYRARKRWECMTYDDYTAELFMRDTKPYNPALYDKALQYLLDNGMTLSDLELKKEN